MLKTILSHLQCRDNNQKVKNVTKCMSECVGSERKRPFSVIQWLKQNYTVSQQKFPPLYSL